MNIKCVVCGEPWDSYGVNNGDMEKWEAHLFKQGSGCPSCEGKVEKQFEPKSLADLSNGDGDEFERIEAHERFRTGNATPWVKPDCTVHWTCVGCGVQVISQPFEDECEYHLPGGAVSSHWFHAHDYRNGNPEKTPHAVLNKDNYCEFCVTECSGCSTTVIKHGETEMYAEGWATNLEGEGYNNLYCSDCFEKSCNECSCIECTCEHEDEDEEEEHEHDDEA